MFSLSCMEKPASCYLLSSAHEKGIGISSTGDLFLTSIEKEWETWILYSDSFSLLHDNDNVMLYSTTRKTYLTSTGEGFLCQTCSQDHKSARWFVKRFKADKFRIGSMEYQKSLRCDYNKRLSTSDNILDDFCNWKIILKTGRLCFITLLVESSSRFQLGSWEDKVHLTKHKNKMQVWRIIELEKNNIWISSWVHDSYFLCTDKDGKLFMTNDRFSEGVKWRIENKPKTLIISYHFNTVIDIKYYSGSRPPLKELEESLNARNRSMKKSHSFSLSSACRNEYSIAPAISSGWLNCSDSDDCLYSSNYVSHIDQKMGCKWDLEQNGKNFCISSSNTKLMKQTSWQIIKSLDGTWLLVSEKGEYLTYNKDGKVFLATEQEEWNTWCLEPCLPGHPKWHVSHPFFD